MISPVDGLLAISSVRIVEIRMFRRRFCSYDLSICPDGAGVFYISVTGNVAGHRVRLLGRL